VNIIILLVCLPSKFGFSNQLCVEFKASRDLGAASGAYIDKNYNRCYRLLKPYLRCKDDHCYGGIKYQLALLFYYGEGVALNREMATMLFKESADLGWDDAIQYLEEVRKFKNKKTL